MSESITDIKSQAEFHEILKKSTGLTVIHFRAEWAPQCQQITDVLKELSKDASYSSTCFLQVEAESIPEISMKYEIAAVPTCVLIKNNKVVDKVNGANIPLLSEKVQLYSEKSTNVTKTESPEEVLNRRLRTLINSSPVLLFMKGNRDQARCGFSKQIIEILNGEGIQYSTFDILQDEAVRQGLKKFSDWPTYPQLYANGELLGGLDIVKEMVASGELKSQLPVTKSLDDRLKELISKERVMLFMKGSPDSPQCGFSRTMVGILDEFGEAYGHFDILSDDEVRQGLKKYSNWPTYPQLYVNGELLGGLDIVKEMRESGDLESSLSEGK